MADEIQVKKGQLWQTGPSNKSGASRTVRITYVWTSSPRVDAVNLDNDRTTQISLDTLLKRYTCVRETE